MHSSFSVSETPDEDGHRERERRISYWPVVFLAFGGVLTLAWIGFLLWAFVQLVMWVIG